MHIEHSECSELTDEQIEFLKEGLVFKNDYKLLFISTPSTIELKSLDKKNSGENQ